LVSSVGFVVSQVRNELKVTIDADTFYGFRHALETLSQMITFDLEEQCLRMPNKVQVRAELARIPNKEYICIYLFIYVYICTRYTYYALGIHIIHIMH
jgi:hypothetical protein